MKVVILNGSPRRAGNCSTIIKTIEDKLRKDNIETEELFLCSGNGIASCSACFECFSEQNGVCINDKDEFNRIHGKVVDADGILVVTPVYTAAPSAPVKAFMERSSLVSMANGGQLDRKPAASFAVARRAGAVPALDSINRYFQVCSMITVGSTYWNILYGNEAGECLKDEEGVETLNNMLLNFAWLLKTIELSKANLPEPETVRTKFFNFIR